MESNSRVGGFSSLAIFSEILHPLTPWLIKRVGDGSNKVESHEEHSAMNDKWVFRKTNKNWTGKTGDDLNGNAKKAHEIWNSNTSVQFPLAILDGHLDNRSITPFNFCSKELVK